MNELNGLKYCCNRCARECRDYLCGIIRLQRRSSPRRSSKGQPEPNTVKEYYAEIANTENEDVSCDPVFPESFGSLPFIERAPQRACPGPADREAAQWKAYTLREGQPSRQRGKAEGTGRGLLTSPLTSRRPEIIDWRRHPGPRYQGSGGPDLS